MDDNQTPTPEQAEALFDEALDLADAHLVKAMQVKEELAPYVAVAMIETAVNRAVEVTSAQDVVEMLHDLIGQIEADLGGDNDNDQA
jgi:hypothetical protein